MFVGFEYYTPRWCNIFKPNAHNTPVIAESLARK